MADDRRIDLDELLETFQATYQGGDGRAAARTPPDDDPGEDEPDPEEAGFTAEE